MRRLNNKLVAWRENMWRYLPDGFGAGYRKALDIDSGPQRVAITLSEIKDGYSNDRGCALFHSEFMGPGGARFRW